jgi:uncharacterized protein (TIGR02594 family)
MPSLIEVWDSRLGIAEKAGSQHNDIILDWNKSIGWESIKDDETAWCATSMSSAAKEAGLPMPAHPQRPLARSWLTMGVAVKPEDAQPGDIMVEPRGNSSWQGHVSMIRHVKREAGKTRVRCIGGNQTLKGTGGAVTLTGWKDISAALPGGIRRLVPATVPELRKAGSTTVKSADNEQKLGIVGAFFVPIYEGARAVWDFTFGSIDVPQFASVPESLSWWGTVLEQTNRVGQYAIDHPVLAVVLVGGVALWVRGHLIKKSRVVEHANGVPIGAEVARLGAV